VPDQAAASTPWLHVEGKWIKDDAGNNVVLRGVSLTDIRVADQLRPGESARSIIDRVTDDTNGWYAKVIRLPIAPDGVEGVAGWNQDPDYYFNNHLKPAVDHCVAKGLYVIIDFHYVSDYNSSAIDQSVRNFWSYVAPRFADVPNVIFEPFNEPIRPLSWSAWKSVVQPWVDIIHAAAPNNLILVGAPQWSQLTAGAINDPIGPLDKVAYVCHIYPIHSEVNWDFYFGETSNHRPVVLTEWGYQSPGDSVVQGRTTGYGQLFKSYVEARENMGWVAWVADYSWQPVIFDRSMNLLGGKNHMGQFLKDWLFEKRDSHLAGGRPNPDPDRMSPPADLDASKSGRRVTLTWHDSAGNEEGFYVERSPFKAGVFVRVASLPADSTSFSERVEEKGKYLYRITAFNRTTRRESDYSNTFKIGVK
jgi:endoglucanase